MAIQFSCSSCMQPIEVDDEFAGQTASCPYCFRVVTVPQKSTYQPSQSVAARPAGPPPLPGENPSGGASLPPVPPPYPSYPAPPRPATSAYGNYALICTLLAVVLIGVTVARSAPYFMNLMNAKSAKNPDGSRMPMSQPSQEEMNQVLHQIMGDPWIIGGNLGGAFFAVVGFALAIASVRQGASGNWQGWTSLVVCGLMLSCYCLSFIRPILGGAPAS